MHVSLTCPLTCIFLQLLIREDIGHACIFIVHNGSLGPAKTFFFLFLEAPRGPMQLKPGPIRGTEGL